MNAKTITNAMTVDVEDYFQVSAFEPIAPREKWGEFQPRVEQNTHKVLDLFAEKNIKATFFTLGIVAQQNPGVIKRIVDEGHELASHGMFHQRVTEMTPEEFGQDIKDSKALLEDLGGQAVRGYRAPSYSISKANLWAHEVLQESGYQYSSSVYPVKHDLYGIPDAPRFAYRPDNAPELVEIPITTFPLMGKNLPIGGGGYFRLFPYMLYRSLLKRFNQGENNSALFYFHPWEVDPEQPRPEGLSAKSRFRHYLNLDKTYHRLDRLTSEFNWGRMDTIFLENQA
ncbi:XrtA system polysaccharide deacetylase [Pleionea sp. CnH1-48]|uniref:XrtA system polysaccharide deacetylase n=1 Tax=Pleionea sp. CnH1-48 TaxID=2954494 RepID=UPI0020969470|nr:XrtA system polysaccharide deacetylase [Pleionea sp. CnH1-48]MCO7226252.1 DUF3473 domain-containing protein [Pleionea sp. CnH1-48]